MGSIFIANIGNRNLKFKGEFLTQAFSDKPLPEHETFRGRTKFLLDEIDIIGNLEDFETVIIDEILRSHHSEIDTAIIVSSNMPESIRNDQDTIFEGDILCRIFSQKYTDITFKNQYFKAKVFNHDELFKSYRPFLEAIKKDNPDNPIIYCDAGGTSQQKLAMKISLEYLYDPDQLTIFYVAQNEKGKSTLVPGESYEYRKIIDMEHVFRAIHSSSYADAIGLLINIGIKPEPKIRLVRFLEARYRLLQTDAFCHSKQILHSKLISPQFIHNFNNGIAIGNYDACEGLIPEESFFRLCEIQALFKRKLNQGVTEQAVHYFAMFCENYLSAVIKEQFGYKLEGYKYESEAYRMLNDLTSGKIEIEDTDLKIDKVGVPLLILIAATIENEFNQKVIKIIRNCNSILSEYKVPGKPFFGLDYYRNKYAHNGQALLLSDLEKQPYFLDIMDTFKLFGMHESCIYEKMNNEVIEILKL